MLKKKLNIINHSTTKSIKSPLVLLFVCTLLGCNDLRVQEKYLLCDISKETKLFHNTILVVFNKDCGDEIYYIVVNNNRHKLIKTSSKNEYEYVLKENKKSYSDRSFVKMIEESYIINEKKEKINRSYNYLFDISVSESYFRNKGIFLE